MSFSAAKLEEKLAAANESQESITTTSQWIMFHKRHVQEEARVWAAALAAAPAPRKLILLYIANDVVQQARHKKREEFVAAFAGVLPGAVVSAYGAVAPDVQNKIQRLVTVWRERSVFPQQTLAEIEAQLPAAAAGRRGAAPSGFFSQAAAAPKRSAPAPGAAGGASVPAGVAALVAKYRELEPVEQLWRSRRENARADFAKTFASDAAPAPAAYLAQVEGLERTLRGASDAAGALDAQYTAAAAALEQQLAALHENHEQLRTARAELGPQLARAAETREGLLEMLHGGDGELPSPAVEAPTPEADDDETDALAPVPELDDEVPAYAPDSDDEAPSKRPKTAVGLAPDLAAFLENMKGK